MGDDLGRLREAMSGLAEHGGSTDLYRGTLDRSRRLGRRRTAGWASAVAVIVLLIGLPVALGRQQRPAGLPPAAAISATPVVPAAPALPSSAPVTPRTVRPRVTERPVATSVPSPRRSPVARPGADGCPVDAPALQRAAGLPEGVRITPATVECRDGWAVAGTATTAGLLFFEYDPSTGRWQYREQGRRLTCSELPFSASPGICEPL